MVNEENKYINMFGKSTFEKNVLYKLEYILRLEVKISINLFKWY